jgi:parallel beta-helix repeat protein
MIVRPRATTRRAVLGTTVAWIAILGSTLGTACGGPSPAGTGEVTLTVPPSASSGAERTSSTHQADTPAGCMNITSPVSYVLTGDLSGNGSGPCLAIANTSGVSIDCQGHTIGHASTDITVANTNGYTIKNCTLPDGVSISGSSAGTFTNNTVGTSPAQARSFTVTQSQGLSIASSMINGPYLQTYGSQVILNGNTFSASSSGQVASIFFGRSNSLVGNTFNGGGGATDGVLLMDERDDTLYGNTIENTTSSGIKVQGALTSSAIANNTISNVIFGLGGWDWLSFLDNEVSANTISGAAMPFDFARSCGLRSAGWTDGLPGPGLQFADTGVYFYGNSFDRNRFVTPSVTGCGGIPFMRNGNYLDYDNSLCAFDGSEVRPAASQFFVSSNAFANNDFAATLCYPGPDFGEPAVPGAVIDRGDNACNPGSSTDYPLACGAFVAPAPTPLDSVDMLASTQTGGATTCNGAFDNVGTGLAYSGTPAFGPDPNQDWRYVLALIYGGLNLTTGVVDCGQPARQTLVANWSNIFQNGCANGASVCASLGGGLQHAFRPDDASPAAAVFASLLGLSPAPSASAINGFGVSPYCNALNWDTSAANGATCALGPNRQFLGPGGVFDTVAADALHRRPPPGTWGDAPDQSSVRKLAADVLPTSYQDNDPIRRPCAGGVTNNALRSGEEVCNIEGTLGLVLALPASDFIPAQNPGLDPYPTNRCTRYVLSYPPSTYTCAPRGNLHFAECPNGDAQFGSNCEVPVDGVGNTAQCVATRASVPGIAVRNVSNADGRAYNLHMRNGPAVDGYVTFIQQVVTTSGGTASLDFVGGMGRIHQVETLFASGGSTAGVPPTPCRFPLATDQIGCLVQADPCSIGFAGDGARTDFTNGAGALRVSQHAVTSAPYPLVCPGSTSCQH